MPSVYIPSIDEEIMLPPGWKPGRRPPANFSSISLSWSTTAYQLGYVHVDRTAQWAELHAWLEANDLCIYDIPMRTQDVILYTEGETELTIKAVSDYPIETKARYAGTYPVADILQGRTCRSCRAINNFGATTCRVCQTVLVCSCTAYPFLNDRVRGTIVEDENTFCFHCGDTCECGNLMPEGFEMCTECAPRNRCVACLGTYYDENLTDERGNNYCTHCYEHVCHNCGFAPDRTPFGEDEEGHRICRTCVVGGYGGEDWDEDASMLATKLLLPTIPGRETIRTCGVEIEGVNAVRGTKAGNYIAAKLYDAGLSNYDRMSQSYHDRGNTGFAHVERDSSVDWELVIGPVNMASREQVQKLNKAVKIVREAIKDNQAKLNLQCGLHVHVSAERVALHQAFNLHILYSYLEDVFYRLGSAKWSIHRAITNTDHYCRRNLKLDKKSDFARTYAENRYYGLSFSNYFEKMLNGCGCGAARYGAFEECTCNLGKCTFEFRVFNTTANTKKIHAYLALTQALVAKAIEMPEIKDIDKYAALPFNLEVFEKMHDRDKEWLVAEWQPRMDFILNELPLTAGEKESLMYCVQNSEIANLGLTTPTQEVIV